MIVVLVGRTPAKANCMKLAQPFPPLSACTHVLGDELKGGLRVILIRELFFFPNFRHFFRAIFQSSIFSWVFFPKYWNVNELVIFGSGEFHE